MEVWKGASAALQHTKQRGNWECHLVLGQCWGACSCGLTPGRVLLPAVLVQPSVLPIQQQQQQPQTSSWQPDAPNDPQTLLQEAENIRQLLLRNR